MKTSKQIALKIPGLAMAGLFLAGCATMSVQQPRDDYREMDHITKTIYRKAAKFARNCIDKGEPVSVSRGLRVDSVLVDRQNKNIDVYFNWILGQVPYREETVRRVYGAFRKGLGWRYRKYDLRIYSKKFPVEELIPNYFRPDTAAWDQARMARAAKLTPVVRNISKPWQPSAGLYQRHIALWHSHGWYYENSLNRWEWQRARVFQIVEDLFPMSFTLPYLIPMLENAGANVFVPRERDIQTHELIVDNDSCSDGCDYTEHFQDSSVVFYTSADSDGFAIGVPPYESGDNPFQNGTYRYFNADSVETAYVEFIPDIPETGSYAVTVAYKSLENSISDTRYTVFHTGGKTEFLVNQQIGGGTWIYLGTFKFNAGRNPETGKVVISNKSRQPGGMITVDAVRFGGGMGNIVRNGQVSGRPRYAEAARYYLQYAGMPDSLVYSLNGDSIDYNDDYQCRGEWVNYLKGAPFGPTKNPGAKGLGIPIDLSLAFHTDAGKTRNGIVIGTLSIYNTDGADTTYRFPDGQSRLANRDLADVLQTQIVADIRAKYDPVWNRRALWDRGYSEAWRPNVPAALLELLSHQNFLDMKFGNDPRFRFDVSRSIYKAFLRFIATEYKTKYVVQPLPVDHFQAVLVDSNSVRLQWKPVFDPLEPTARAEKYIVYTRIGDNGFDNGRLVGSAAVTIRNLKPGVIYSYKVSAVNAGGESFPSEILAVCFGDSLKEPVLIVNGFDRIAPPATIETEKYLGFANFWDQGVPDVYDIGYIGEQYDFLDESRWLDDDSPGHGASYADYECKIVAGNTHDFVINHGKSIVAAGYGFVSASDEAVGDGDLDITKYKVIDLIMGEEKLTGGPKPFLPKEFEVYPAALRLKLTEYCQSGGSIFVSGAYIATDPFIYVEDDSTSIKFVENNLKYRWRTNYAVKTGGVYSVAPDFMTFGESFQFNTELNPYIYAAEAPDALEPADSLAVTLLRYSENNTSAAVGYAGQHRVIAFGFPFETIPKRTDRDKVMRAVLTFLERKK